MTRLDWIAAGLFSLALLPSSAASDTPAAQGRPAIVEVKLPADAILEIDGKVTSSTGAERRFQSPPLSAPPNGKSYIYGFKVTWMGKDIVRNVAVKPSEVTKVVFAPEEFQGGERPAAAKEPATEKEPAPAIKAVPAKAEKEPNAVKALPERDGFVALERDGRWWIFRKSSKELAAFEKQGEPDKHVTRINVEPFKVTIKSPDIETLEEYLTAKPGFTTKLEEGRLWVFKQGSKELEEYRKQGELAKHVSRINTGPRGMTLKAPDAETLDAYLKAQE